MPKYVIARVDQPGMMLLGVLQKGTKARFCMTNPINATK